ncbi:MAG: flagellar basal body-associated FliL family protein [Methylococcaceae bacterium]|nr:flagellar basal body-associated FliL family protein [Methylococcaceae bacterium]
MAENEVENGDEKKSSKKMIIIGLVILLLAGAGAGYYFFMGNPEELDSEASEEVIDEEEDEEGASVDIYYDMKKSLVVNFPKGSGASLIQVSVSLLVKGEETIEALKKHEPMIRNNLLMAISAKGSKSLMTIEGKEALRGEMLRVVGEVMEKMTKKNKVTNIFFTSFVMQ